VLSVYMISARALWQTLRLNYILYHTTLSCSS